MSIVKRHLASVTLHFDVKNCTWQKIQIFPQNFILQIFVGKKFVKLKWFRARLLPTMIWRKNLRKHIIFDNSVLTRKIGKIGRIFFQTYRSDMSQKQQPLQKRHPMFSPSTRWHQQHSQCRIEVSPICHITIFQPFFFRQLQKGHQILLLSWHRSSRVQDIQCHMHQVRNQIHVTLRTTSSRFAWKALVLSKSQEQQF